MGNLQSLRKRKALTKSDFNIPTEVCFVQYLEKLSKNCDDSDVADKVLGCMRLRWCQIPGTEPTFLSERVYGFVSASSIKGVMHMVRNTAYLHVVKNLHN